MATSAFETYWKALTDNFTDFQLATIGSFLIHECVFFMSGLPYLILENLNVRKFKLQKKSNPASSQIKCVLKLLMYHCLVNLPLIMASYPVFKYMGFRSTLPLPHWSTIVTQIVSYFFIEDFVFYWGHRALHSKWLYQNVHCVHHEYATPFGLTSEYAHPAEILFLGFATILGPALTGPHLLTLWLWMSLRVLETVEAHSGFEFPWSPSRFIPLYGGAEYHDYHHRCVYTDSGNYSSTFIYMDWIFGTDRNYRRMKALKAGSVKDDAPTTNDHISASRGPASAPPPSVTVTRYHVSRPPRAPSPVPPSPPSLPSSHSPASSPLASPSFPPSTFPPNPHPPPHTSPLPPSPPPFPPPPPPAAAVPAATGASAGAGTAGGSNGAVGGAGGGGGAGDKEKAGGEGEGSYVIFNVGESLFVADANSTDKVGRGWGMGKGASHKEPLKALQFMGASGLCHAFDGAVAGREAQSTAGRDAHDLLIATTAGDIYTASLRAQLADGSKKLVGAAHYSPRDGTASSSGSGGSSSGGGKEGSGGSNSRCTAVAWVPGGDGLFVTAHADGNVYVFDKVGRTSSLCVHRDGSTEPGFAPIKDVHAFSTAHARSNKSNPSARWHISPSAINALAFSPSGSHMATVSRDGYLRVFEWEREALEGGCKSYYGAFLCCAFSSDGRLVAAGGEDDLVAVWDRHSQSVLAWCEGHCSWVTAVAFDPFLSSTPPPPSTIASPSATTTAAAAATLPSSSPIPMSSASTGSGAGVVGAAVAPGGAEGSYRVGSVGQDTQLLLLDVALDHAVCPLHLPLCRCDYCLRTPSPLFLHSLPLPTHPTRTRSCCFTAFALTHPSSCTHSPTPVRSPIVGPPYQDTQLLLWDVALDDVVLPLRLHAGHSHHQSAAATSASHPHDVASTSTPPPTHPHSRSHFSHFHSHAPGHASPNRTHGATSASPSTSAAGTATSASSLGLGRSGGARSSSGAGSGAGGGSSSSNAGGGGSGGSSGGALRDAPGSNASHGAAAAVLVPPPSRKDVPRISPVMAHKVHVEPLSALAFSQQAVLTACHEGCVKLWLRPGATPPPGSIAASSTVAVPAAFASPLRGDPQSASPALALSDRGLTSNRTGTAEAAAGAAGGGGSMSAAAAATAVAAGAGARSAVSGQRGFR
ncbi:unnamed protein product [Closterium sp. Naga37s-1]|nr:unnamed protein product [Closterium sp. Naga37s-1]